MRRLPEPHPPPDWYVVVLPADRAAQASRHCCDCDAPDARHRRRVRVDRSGLTLGHDLGARGRVELRWCGRCRMLHLLRQLPAVLLAGTTLVFMLDGDLPARRIPTLPRLDRPQWFRRLALGCLLGLFVSLFLTGRRLQAFAVGHTIRWAFRSESYAARFARDNAPVLVGTSWQVMPAPPAAATPNDAAG